MLDRASLVVAGLALFTPVGVARAQCGTWESQFNPIGFNNVTYAAVSFDDGSGPALYVGGQFTRVGTVDVARVARWDGSVWSAVGSLPFTVNALIVHDLGAGPRLIAACGNSVQVFDGTTWSQLGATFQGPVTTLGAFDEGSGLRLFAGGGFTPSGQLTLRGVARWDGTSWTDVAGGVGVNAVALQVNDMCVHDDGSGPALYVGGSFPGNATINSPDLMRWNGTSWSAVGTGVDPDAFGNVQALAVHDDGSGPRLILGGTFDSAGGVSANYVASWDGTSYAAHGTGLNGTVFGLAVHDGELIAGGSLSSYPSPVLSGAARYVAGTWQGMTGPGSPVYGFASFDLGAGPRLAAVGSFSGAPANRISEWDGSTWTPYADGAGLIGHARSFASFDDGTGPRLFVGGSLFAAGNQAVKGLIRWDGAGWSRLEIELDGWVTSLLAWDDGNGRALYAGGTFLTAGGDPLRRIGRWDGASWTSLGAGVGEAGGFSLDSVDALELYDDGTGEKLYAGGMFALAGDQTAVGVARWDGSAWSDLEIGTSGPVLDLLAFDDGNGPSLFVAGDFTSAGSTPANRIARWDGTQWHALGSGAANGSVMSLAAFDDGSGPALYAGGTFTNMGGVSGATGLARWDGTTWNVVPHTFGAAVQQIVADIGDGPTLIVAAISSVHAKTATGWVQLAAVSNVKGLGMFDSLGDGTPDLYIGGNFSALFSGTLPSVGIASYRGCGESGVTFCANGTMIGCPCGNDGAPGHGCGNSANADGAELSVRGIPSVSDDSLRLECSGMSPNTTTLFVQGTGQSNGGLGTLLGDGVLCLSGAVLRLGSPIADGDFASVGFGAGTLPMSVKGQIPQAGATRFYQVRYRNAASFCTPATFNQSNGASITWYP